MNRVGSNNKKTKSIKQYGGRLGRQNKMERKPRTYAFFLWNKGCTVVGYALSHGPAVTKAGQRVQLNNCILNHPNTSHRNRSIIQQCALCCHIRCSYRYTTHKRPIFRHALCCKQNPAFKITYCKNKNKNNIKTSTLQYTVWACYGICIKSTAYVACFSLDWVHLTLLFFLKGQKAPFYTSTGRGFLHHGHNK